MTRAEQLAAFAVRTSYEDLSEAARGQLKIRVLDALGCAIGALEGEPVQLIRRQIEDFGGAECCSLIGGGQTAPDRAAFYNSALVRYLDFNDSYLAKGETCHPSDNLGAMLAAAEPEVFAWYIKNYGPEVNLFVDHSQVVQLECLRAGIWGTKSLWGRVLTYKG